MRTFDFRSVRFAQGLATFRVTGHRRHLNGGIWLCVVRFMNETFECITLKPKLYEIHSDDLIYALQTFVS